MANSDEQEPGQEEVFEDFDEEDFDYEFDDDFEEETNEEIEEVEAAHEGDFTTPPSGPVHEERGSEESE